MIKCTLVQALRLCTGRTAHRGSGGIALPFHDHGTWSGWGVSVTPRPLFTPGKTRYPLYRRLGGPRAGLDRCGKFRPPPGFDPRTFQHLASRYTDYATRPTNQRRTKYCYQNKMWDKPTDFPTKECSFGYWESSLCFSLFAAMVY